jgi:hypothetical protein
LTDAQDLLIFQGMRIVSAIIFSSFSAICQPSSDHSPISLDDLAISVASSRSRELAYTNKEAGVFYTETNGEHRSGWQGWRVMSNEIL